MRWSAALLAALATPAAAQAPGMVLHQLRVEVDSATFADLAASRFMREEFAAVEAGTEGGRATLTFVARRTLLTVLAPAGPVDEAELAFTFEREAPFRAFMRGHGGGPALALTNGPLRLDVSLPSGSDIARAAARDSLPADDLSRDRFLEGRFRAKRPLQHLASATVAVPLAAIGAVTEALRRGGVRVDDEGEGVVLALEGFRLRLIPAWEHPGVRELAFTLVAPERANPVYRFGAKSRLRFGPGASALWEFHPR